MKALLFSDIHGGREFLEKLPSMIQYYEVILCAGDLTDFGWPEGFVEKLDEVFEGTTCFWVSGNNDIGQDYQYQLKNMQNIDGKIIEYQGHKFAGLGGSYQNYEAQNFGPSLIGKDTNLSDCILLSHIPPSVKLKYSASDVTCPTNNETMKQLDNAPLAHICGHLHSPAGVACLGPTKIIKLAPAKQGNYAELDMEDLTIKFLKI